MCFRKKKKAVKAQKVEKEAAAPAVKEAPKAEASQPKDKPSFRTYHVVKREEDGKWEVKYAGGEKAIKLFDTQKEAVEYTKKMAQNQDGAMLVHNSKGAHKGRIKAK